MAEPNRDRKADETEAPTGEPSAPAGSVTATKARRQFADLVGRVEYADERIPITRRGRVIAVLVPLKDYDRLIA